MQVANHRKLELSFRLKDGLQEDFVKGNPNPALDDLRNLLDEYGANIHTFYYWQCHGDFDETTSMGKLGKQLADVFNADEEKTHERTVSLQLPDERNMKALFISLRQKEFYDVIEFNSQEVDAGGYADPMQVLSPPFPPEKPGATFTYDPD